MIRMMAASAIFSFSITTTMAAGIPAGSAEDDLSGVLDIVGTQAEASDEIQSHFKICPAEIANSARPLWRSLVPGEPLDRGTCGEDIKACYRICMEDRNASACLALGYTLEAASPVVPQRWAQMLFAQACAAGSSGGCTNRAAGIRNGQYGGDPLSDADVDDLRRCFLRTFTLTCRDGDAWGCTMLGQSYQYGEGAPADMLMAKRFYEKSCSIAEDFPACDFARKQMEGFE